MNEPRPTEPNPVSPPATDEISIWEILAVLVRGRWTIVLATVLTGALALVATVMGDDTYTTQAAFRPQGSEVANSQLLALASQFGVGSSASGEEASPAFYAELLKSRQILAAVVEKPYEIDGFGTLLLRDLLEIEADTEALRNEAVLEWLDEQAVTVATEAETGTVTLTVQTEWPDLSVTIAEDLLEGVSRFNLDTRASQAAAERLFTEQRVAEAKAELAAAEDSLRVFLEANRQFDNSPMLVFVYDGLNREVGLRSSVLTTLVQSYEQARISEVRDTPVITVLLNPFMPAGPDERSLKLALALGIVVGGMVGVVLAFLIEAFRNPKAGDPALADFQQSVDGMLRSIPFLGRGRA